MKVQICETRPTSCFVWELARNVENGCLKIPDFQRNFVWERGDIVALFESIVMGYPIGALTLWSPTKMVDGVRDVGRVSSPSSRHGVSLIVDGQQRTTAITGVFLKGSQWWSEDEQDPDRWNLFYDVSKEEFVHLSAEQEQETKKGLSPLIPVNVMLDGYLFTSMIFERFTVSNLQDQERRWILQAQRVSQALTSYRIPIVHLHTEDRSTVIEAFKRLASCGVRMDSEKHLSKIT